MEAAAASRVAGVTNPTSTVPSGSTRASRRLDVTSRPVPQEPETVVPTSLSWRSSGAVCLEVRGTAPTVAQSFPTVRTPVGPATGRASWPSGRITLVTVLVPLGTANTDAGDDPNRRDVKPTWRAGVDCLAE